MRPCRRRLQLLCIKPDAALRAAGRAAVHSDDQPVYPAGRCWHLQPRPPEPANGVRSRALSGSGLTTMLLSRRIRCKWDCRPLPQLWQHHVPNMCASADCCRCLTGTFGPSSWRRAMALSCWQTTTPTLTPLSSTTLPSGYRCVQSTCFVGHTLHSPAGVCLSPLQKGHEGAQKVVNDSHVSTRASMRRSMHRILRWHLSYGR